MRHLLLLFVSCCFLVFLSSCMSTQAQNCPKSEPEFDVCYQYFVEHKLAVNCNAFQENTSNNSEGARVNSKAQKELDKVAVSERTPDGSQNLTEDGAARGESAVANTNIKAAKESLDDVPTAGRQTYPDENEDIGFISITSEPWAIVTVNGVRVGDTPIKLQKVESGSVLVELYNPEKRLKQRKRFSVSEGEVVELSIDFKNEITNTRQYEIAPSKSAESKARKTRDTDDEERAKRKKNRPSDMEMDIPF